MKPVMDVNLPFKGSSKRPLLRAGTVTLHLFVLALTAVILTLRCHGQEFTATKIQNRELQREITQLAYGVPPEFGADALLRLVETGAVLDHKTKLELLNDAFQMAAGAHFKRKFARYFGTTTDTREGWLSYAYDLNLDAESLKCRTVQLMLPLNRSQAVNLFQQISIPQIEEHECRSSLTYDPRIFYQTLVLVVNNGFTAQERQREDHVQLAQPYFSSISSPVQVVPLAGVLLALTLTNNQLARLVGVYSFALTKVQPNDRAFTDGYGLVEAVDEVAELCLKSGILCDDLVRSVRRYIVSNLTAMRCADSAKRTLPAAGRAGERHAGHPIATKFNEWKARFPPYVSREVHSLADEETMPVRVGEAPDDPKYWSSGKAKDLLRDVQVLRFGPRREKGGSKREPLSIDSRKTPEWSSQLHLFLGKLESWKTEDELTEVDYFEQKCKLYMSLIELVPDGVERDRVLNRFAYLLASSRLQHEDPVVWFGNARDLIRLVRRSKLSEAGREKRPERDVGWILKELERSGSMILTLWSKLEKLDPVSDTVH